MSAKIKFFTAAANHTLFKRIIRTSLFCKFATDKKQSKE